MRAFPLAWCLVLAALSPLGAQSPGPVRARTTSLAAVDVTPGPTIVITSAGPLPAPTVGVLHSPERIYLDLAGVSSRAMSAQGDGQLVTTVRVAQHSLDPLVVRVVIDLKQPSRYSVNVTQRESGRLEMSLAATTAIADTSRPKATSVSAQRYIARVEQMLSGASSLRGVLAELDRKAPVPPDRLQQAQADLGRIRGTVDALHPPASLSDAHDLLRSALGFAATSLSLASSSTAAVSGNASSAAAGALMMLDRAQAELRGDGAKMTTDQFVGRQGSW